MGDELRTRLHKEKNEVTGLEEKLRELEVQPPPPLLNTVAHRPFNYAYYYD